MRCPATVPENFSKETGITVEAFVFGVLQGIF